MLHTLLENKSLNNVYAEVGKYLSKNFGFIL